MPVTKVRSKWDSGNLIFEDLSGNQVAGITPTGLELGVSGTALSATAAEVNAVNGAVADFTFAAAAGAANVTEVTITAKDADGATVAVPHVFTVWLSDAATGAGLTGTTASGTVTAKASSGAVIGTLTAKKALVVQALATGVFILEITDTAKTGFYVCAQSFNGLVQAADQLESGDYG